MEVIRRDKGCSSLLFRVLNKLQGDTCPPRFLHSAVFCKATPEMKPWVVELLQGKHTSLDHHRFQDNTEQRCAQDYVMAVGDGANDLNMLSVADVSMGIRSGDSMSVCNQASVWHANSWNSIVPLLHEDGVHKALMLATMAKLIYLKHWMMAAALWMYLLVGSFVCLFIFFSLLQAS